MRTSAEDCTQIASYFDVVDNCIALSDTNKSYALNPQTTYSPSRPIKSGSYTTCIISPNTHNTADIYWLYSSRYESNSKNIYTYIK